MSIEDVTKSMDCGYIENSSMEDHSLIPEESLMSRIYLIRGQKEMLDFDLALLYGVETKVLKQSVRRNLRRFP